MGQSLSFQSMYYQCSPVSFFFLDMCIGEKYFFYWFYNFDSIKLISERRLSKKKFWVVALQFFLLAGVGKICFPYYCSSFRDISIVCVILRPFLEAGTSLLRFANHAFEAWVLVLRQYILYRHLNCNKCQIIRTSHRRYFITSSFTHLTEHCSNTRLWKERRNWLVKQSNKFSLRLRQQKYWLHVDQIQQSITESLFFSKKNFTARTANKFWTCDTREKSKWEILFKLSFVFCQSHCTTNMLKLDLHPQRRIVLVACCSVCLF